MKKILFLIALALSSLTIMAQGPRKAELKDGQVLVGLYTSDDYSKLGVGFGMNAPLQVGTRITEKYYAGMTNLKVAAVRFAINDNTFINAIRLYALTDDKTIVGPIATKAWDKKCTKGWNLIEFDTPIEVKPEYVALLPTYEFQQTMSNIVIACSMEPKEPSFTVYGPLRTDQEESIWANMNTAKYGSAAIQLVCTADDIQGVRVAPDGYSSNTVVVGQTFKPTLSINCTSEEPVSSIEYTLTLGDKHVKKSHTFSPALAAGFNQRHDFESEIVAPDKAGAYSITFEIDKVNGTPLSRPASAQYKQQVVTRKAHRMTLVEEFTGTECGYCPRGWIGMEKVKKELPNDACVIAMHQYNAPNTSDPMYVSSYHMPSFIGGAPAAVVDRAPRSCDPYFGDKVDGKDEGILNTVMRYEQLLPEVDIQNLTANFTDENHTHVLATATTEFLTDLDGSQIIFALTADGLTGTGREWKQTNFYGSMTPEQAGATPESNPELYQLLSGQPLGDTYLSLVFNDVLIGSSWLAPNTPNEVLAFTTTKAGTKASSLYTIPMPTSKKLLAAIDMGQVYLTAFVLKADGTVANAARCKVSLTPREADNRCMYVEDATGTWCGWCPKGLVGLKEMRKAYPGKFIGVGVHCGADPMNTFKSYEEWIVGLGLTAYPTCYINRNGVPRNPNFSVLNDIYNQEFRRYSELNVEAEASVQGQELKMTAHITPLMDLYATNYTLAFVVMEDGIKGVQDNFYSDGNSGEMGGFEKLPMKASIEYEDIARGIWPTVTGLGSGAIALPADMAGGQTVSKTCSVPLSYFVSQDIKRCHVAVLVITPQGEVENAAEVWLDPTAGILTPLRPAETEAPAYDLQGRPAMNAATRGISISAGRKILR